jgi:hypothetical protein
VYWSPRAMSVQKRPATRQIQPIGFSGRLEAIRAPTIVKARKGARINRLPMAPPEPQSLESCAAGAVTYKDKMVSMALATNIAPERPASDQASQEEARVYALPTSRSRRCVPSATTPLYRTLVSQALRNALRESIRTNFLERRAYELRRTPPLRLSEKGYEQRSERGFGQYKGGEMGR